MKDFNMKQEIMMNPEGIIITISEKMLKEKGYRNWLSNFLFAMDQHPDITYWMRQGTQPRESVRDKLQYVYLCIGGKIRFRAYYGGCEGQSTKTFGSWAGNGKPSTITGKAWIILSGPVERPVKGDVWEKKGFRGFRYTQKLF